MKEVVEEEKEDDDRTLETNPVNSCSTSGRENEGEIFELTFR